MNIIYVSQVFPPDAGASVRALEQAKCLQRLGHDVTVVTTMSYYPLGIPHPDYQGRFCLRENVDGLDVVRIWSLPAPNRGIVRRVLSQLSFALNSFCVAVYLNRPELVIASTHIFAVELAVILLAKLRRCRSLIEFRDLIPENLELVGVSQRGIQATFLRHYFNLCFRLADFVAVPSDTMIPHLLRRGVRHEQILLLPHATQRSKFECAEPAKVAEKYGLTNKFVVVYAGSFSVYYDVPNIMRAANLLTAAHQDIRVLIVGDGQDTPRLKEIERHWPNPNVILTGKVTPDEVPAFLKAADLNVTSLVAPIVPEFYRGYPTTKIAEYLMAGKAILAVENTPIMGELLNRIGAGESIRGNDPEALAEAIVQLRANRAKLEEYGRKGRAYALENMDRMPVVTKFCKDLLAKMEPARCTSHC
jgi:hypothetical protein